MVRRHRGSKDGNHDEVAARFVALGCDVVDMHACGVRDFLDLVVGCAGVTHIVEVKNPETRYGRAGLTIGQSAFARDWRGGKVYVVTSPDEAEALVMNWRRALR